jgi:hypothetical protein
MVCFKPFPLHSWGKAIGIHWIEGCVEAKASLDIVEKRKIFALPGFEHRPFSP